MRSEGARRLSILLGLFGLFVWIIFILIATECFQEVNSQKWPEFFIVVIAGMLISFFLPFGLVRAIAWVVDGFKSAKHQA